jgi:ATP-binding cassette subfamily G (WHITE) protein 2 (SNQ2)
MIDIVSGGMSKDQDWAQVWSDSDLCKEQKEELEKIKSSGSEGQDKREDDGDEYASSTATQLKLVTKRASIQLWRDTEYVVNKVSTHADTTILSSRCRLCFTSLPH